MDGWAAVGTEHDVALLKYHFARIAVFFFCCCICRSHWTGLDVFRFGQYFSPKSLRRCGNSGTATHHTVCTSSSQAANYLDIKGLLDVTCKTVANMIKGKTPEEIRKTFNIKNDFTEEEEAQVSAPSALARLPSTVGVKLLEGHVSLPSRSVSFAGTQREPVVWREVNRWRGGPTNATTLNRNC